MHGGAWSGARAWQVCERFAKFGKPLHFTEVTVVSGKRTKQGWNTTPEGEKRQARQVVEFYRTLFSHPAVEAITWWDFSDQGAWQRAPAGLVRKDMSPKPAYLALKDLIEKQWWTGPLELKTDAAGRVTFRGFLGHYEVEAGGRQGSFRLENAGTAAVRAALSYPAQRTARPASQERGACCLPFETPRVPCYTVDIRMRRARGSRRTTGR